MNRGIFPIILVVLAVALFMFFTDDTYQSTKELRATLTQHETVLSQSEAVLELRDQLLARRNNISQDSIARLQQMLPDNIDNIRLIININDIAARHHMQVQGISVGGQRSDEDTGSTVVPIGPGAAAIGSVTMGFSVDASYEDFLAFLNDLEHSLRLIDVTSISFAASGKGADSYSMTILTYWLK